VICRQRKQNLSFPQNQCDITMGCVLSPNEESRSMNTLSEPPEQTAAPASAPSAKRSNASSPAASKSKPNLARSSSARKTYRANPHRALAGGHCLITGAPGLAKTLLVKSIARIFHLNFQRIQFTPDLMPADITGTEILQDTGEGRR